MNESHAYEFKVKDMFNVFRFSKDTVLLTAIGFLFVKHPWMVAINGKPGYLANFSWAKPEFVEK